MESRRARRELNSSGRENGGGQSVLLRKAFVDGVISFSVVIV